MQLPLPVSLPVDETFASFETGNNQHVVELLQDLGELLPNWQSGDALAGLYSSAYPLINIIGGTGKGKSHLLYAICHQLASRQVPHIYIDMNEAVEWPAQALESLEQLPLICLDSLEAIAGKSDWEEAVFDLINRVTETRRSVLVFASQLGPQHPDYLLPDLRSRLSAGLTYQLHSLDEQQRAGLIKKRAMQKGLDLSNQALQFLLHHSDRDLASLMSLLERLDTRSLQEQKRLSVAMVKRELGL